MIGRIVEIADDNRHLSAFRGFLVVSERTGERRELGRVPLDDIAAVVAHAHGLSYSNNLLVGLAERAVPFVLCGPNHCPVGMLWPLDGNFQQAKRMDAQIGATRPCRKRLWAEIVRAKLNQQASVLKAVGAAPAPLQALVAKVRSGDPANIEAQGARRYWTLLFGSGFRRSRAGDGPNPLLNYGYTIQRAAMARAIIAAGLHPGIPLHHANESNPMRLADDLMEPFRPIVDLRVKRLIDSGVREVDSESKRTLVRTLLVDMQTGNGATPVMVCMQRLATSLAQVFLCNLKSLELPLPGLPLEMAPANA